MTVENKNPRRSLLKAIAGAGSLYTAGKLLPETWTRPVVDAVSLPAHAQTSGTYFDEVVVPFIVDGGSPGGGGILDLIVPTAHAQTASTRGYICVVPSGANAQVDVVIPDDLFGRGDGGIHLSAVAPIGGGPVALSVEAVGENCKEPKSSWSVRLDSLAKGTVFEGSYLWFNFDLPQQDCNLPSLRACKSESPT
jgi:hypothetical protein